MLLTQERLRELVYYCSNSGAIFWLQSRKKAKSGTRAGSPHNAGYERIRIDGRSYMAHRLAWLYVHGYMPDNDIDHINGNRTDNRINNLRECSRGHNLYNMTMRSNNKSGIKGVSWHKSSKKWRATLIVNKQQLTIGYFDEKEDARKAVMAERERLHGEYCNHG